MNENADEFVQSLFGYATKVHRKGLNMVPVMLLEDEAWGLRISVNSIYV